MKLPWTALAVAAMFLAAVSSLSVPRQQSQVAAQLERLAATTSHFATQDIVYNRREERRWPAELTKQQDDLAAALRALGGRREDLAALLRHADPKVRTLALGALFMREDAHDLPLIAALRGDAAATFPLIRESPASSGGRLPLSAFEDNQTVGGVALAMMDFWLQPMGGPKFEDYWAEHEKRAFSAGWFLVKLRRATRQISPLQPEYRADVRRVLAEIDALPPLDRAWTLLYVRTSGYFDQEALMSDAALVNTIRIIGADGLMKLLRQEPPTDDPAFKPVVAFVGNGMSRFILTHARELLRASDADAVLARAEVDRVSNDPTMWRSAAAELLALDNADDAAQALKQDIARIRLKGYAGQREQAALAAALWRIRGPKENAYLVDWFYTALPLAEFVHGPDLFFQAIAKDPRPDTKQLAGAIAADPRFSRVDLKLLVDLLGIVNRTVRAPLVTNEVIANYDYGYHAWGSELPDLRETLARWRNLLRNHFGVPQLPAAPARATPLRVVSTPTWTRALNREPGSSPVALAVSSDGRLLATGDEGNYTVVLRNAANGERAGTIADNGSGAFVIGFPPGASEPRILSTARDGIQSLQVAGNGPASTWKAKGPEPHSRGAVDSRVARYVSNVLSGGPGVFDLERGQLLWRIDERVGPPAAVAISGNGGVVAVGGGDWPKIARAYDAASGKILFESADFCGPIVGLALTADGTRLVTAAVGDEIRIWNVTSGQIERRLAYSVRGADVPSPVVIAPDGRWLAVNHNAAIGVFDLSTGSLRWEVRLPSASYPAIAFSPDGKRLYTSDSRLAAWSLE
jgi:hypothetical protein